MTLDRSRLIVRYYLWLARFFGSEYSAMRIIERGTNLCGFCWRIILGTAAIAGVSAIGLLILTGLGFAIIYDPWNLLMGLSVVLGGFSLLLLIGVIVLGATRLAKSENMAVTYIKSIKRGICPLIKFTR